MNKRQHENYFFDNLIANTFLIKQIVTKILKFK